MEKRRKDDHFESTDELVKLADRQELTREQKKLCEYLNDCFLNSCSNPITIALWITKELDVKLKKKKAKKAS